MAAEMYEKVIATVNFSRGLFGKRADAAYIEKLLRDLSLWDKRDAKVMELSGGMKRRVLIAKALAHEPEILFLDEPTAGVDVELRRDMWNLRSEEHTSALQSLMRISYAVFCLKKTTIDSQLTRLCSMT